MNLGYCTGLCFDPIAELLAGGIKKNKTLKSLNLAKAKFKEKGLIAIADAIKENTSLTNVDLSLCPVTLASAKALAEAFRASPNLKVVDVELPFALAGDKEKEEIEQILSEKFNDLTINVNKK